MRNVQKEERFDLPPESPVTEVLSFDSAVILARYNVNGEYIAWHYIKALYLYIRYNAFGQLTCKQ